MTDPRGPVVVGMSTLAEMPEHTYFAIEIAARQAIRRGVDLRLAYGLRDLPQWRRTAQLIAETVDRLTRSNEALVVTTVLFPGTAVDALTAAARGASLVVACGSDNEAALDELVTRLSGGPAPVLVVPPATAEAVPALDWSRTPAWLADAARENAALVHELD